MIFLRRKIEVELKKGVGYSINDFRLFGEQEDRVIAATRDGCVIQYSLGNKSKRGVVAHYQEELFKNRKEQGNPIAVAVFEKNHHVLV